ncbi:MAG: hypothetical protein QG574_2641 [Cyanobacteriota bacterium erpe_2018_sw_21hr_WHONDRS-SW48-000092_B_bin.40]|jgi:hypothetical protein|nr:hypothetical protein [Cyanobacteriota bacterium erpe_2018_sw_21hr_WHONDRS-SW48-000092_B_bin.40]
MTTLPTRDRSHLQLVVNNVVAANGGLRSASPSVSPSASPSPGAAEERSFSPVRLVRTVESTACADALVDAYHSQRQVTPFRSVLRIELSETIDRVMLGLAISELESRGWTVTSATFRDDEITSSRALWLRPYA